MQLGKSLTITCHRILVQLMMPTPSSFGEKTCSADEVKRGLDDFVPSTSIDDRWYSSISPEEAAKKDKVEYRHLRSVDPKCTILSTIFNRCSENINVPDRWKTSSTILIHKKGDASDVSNSRPIALMSCIYKLFMSVIANRLISSHLRSTTTSFLIVRRVLVQPKDVMNIPLFFIP